MRKAVFLVFFLLLGCTSRIVCDDGRIVDDINKCYASQAEETEAREDAESGAAEAEPQAEEILEDADAEIKEPQAEKKSQEKPATKTPSLKEDLLERSGKLKGITYTYFDTKTLPKTYKFHVAGQYVKYDLGEQTRTENDVYYSTVYLDTKNRKAVGFCEIRSSSCLDEDQYDSEGEERDRYLVYWEHEYKTPYDWLNLMNNPKVVSHETLYGRELTVIEFKDKGQPVRMWVDTDYLGLPLKVVKGDIEYTFRDLAGYRSGVKHEWFSRLIEHLG